MTVGQVQRLQRMVKEHQSTEELRDTFILRKFPAIMESLAKDAEKLMGEIEALNDELAKELTE
jgi:hypothetical protein